MIKGGTGGAKTRTGLLFEGRVDLKTLFVDVKDYSVNGNQLLHKGKVVALLYKKNQLYSHFLESNNIIWEGKLSKKLIPDQTIFIIKSNTLFVIEMKFQKVPGSVDEKLQTCDFKKKQYEKLLAGSDIKVEYCYILSDWFKAKRYADTLNYIKSMGCEYFFGELPFSHLGLPNPDV